MKCWAYLELKHLQCPCDECVHLRFLAVLESRMLNAPTQEESEKWAVLLKEFSK